MCAHDLKPSGALLHLGWHGRTSYIGIGFQRGILCICIRAKLCNLLRSLHSGPSDLPSAAAPLAVTTRQSVYAIWAFADEDVHRNCDEIPHVNYDPILTQEFSPTYIDSRIHDPTQIAERRTSLGWNLVRWKRTTHESYLCLVSINAANH